MKIGIITFHNTSNYGATLQCTALSNYLKKKGNQVEIINYLPNYVLEKKSVFKELKKCKRAKNKGKMLLKGLAYCLYARSIRKRDEAFERFINRNLALTSVYHTNQQLTDNPPVADLYICGSDQIWNPMLTGGHLDRAFFLQFTEKTKATYGVSVGELDIEKYASELKKLTNDFALISAREQDTALRLSKVLGKKVYTVLDCSFLLNQADYSPLESKVSSRICKGPYLLLYNIQRQEKANLIAKKIAEENHLIIVDISPNPFIRIKDSSKIMDIGPGEFLWLINHADYIVTNSFHGTVFSIIFEKQFYSIPHNTRSGRVIDLLGMLHLEDRIITDVSQISEDTIDYCAVSVALNKMKTDSVEYIDRLLVANEFSGR